MPVSLQPWQLFVSTANVFHLWSVSRSRGINIHTGAWKKFCLQFVSYSCYGRWHFCLTKAVKFAWIYCKIWICMQFIFIHIGLLGTFRDRPCLSDHCNTPSQTHELLKFFGILVSQVIWLTFMELQPTKGILEAGILLGKQPT